jgi:hypothetical protein
MDLTTLLISPRIGKSRIVEVKYPGYRGLSVMAQNSGYDRFSLVANGWGSTHLVTDKAPSL